MQHRRYPYIVCLCLAYANGWRGIPLSLKRENEIGPWRMGRDRLLHRSYAVPTALTRPTWAARAVNEKKWWEVVTFAEEMKQIVWRRSRLKVVTVATSVGVRYCMMSSPRMCVRMVNMLLVGDGGQHSLEIGREAHVEK